MIDDAVVIDAVVHGYHSAPERNPGRVSLLGGIWPSHPELSLA